MSGTSDISLHVISKKKRAKVRWTVLILVQILILLHIAMWLLSKHFGWFGGETITPIEPSDGMELVKNGVINAGAIFFALALLSTCMFGRWFCGWGCHIVFLQDWCFALLRKLGIRPKPFRARLLGWVPLGLGLYMFVWPLFYRIVLAPWLQPHLRWPAITTDLTTEHFWETFVSPLMAIPFLFVCGFATVYTLGAKGFCTYGCPYGGFFAPLDRIAPVRIRVNDNCQQCGKCTAVCTSNVRVHEEVHLHKMVVDSGCMKTMDCIDACPNDALSVGFIGASIGTKSARKTGKYDLTISGELWIAAIFLIGFFSFRGLYALVPMLMAVGMSLVSTWIIWKGWSIADMRKTTGTWTVVISINGEPFITVPVEVVETVDSNFNRPPENISVNISASPSGSSVPTPEDVLTCCLTTDGPLGDLDWDLVRYQYIWLIDGNTVRNVITAGTADHLPRQLTNHGQVVTCIVTPSDGIVDGVAVSDEVTIAIDCPDINGDGYVNVSDLLVVIDQWGLANSPADVNEDGIVDVSDLLMVVGNWGPCE